MSSCTNLAGALIGTGFVYKPTGVPLEEYLKTFSILLKTSSVRRCGSAALDLAYVAAGRLDGFWDASLKPWDIAAGSILIKEAGGFISDFLGENNYLISGDIIAGNVKIYQELVKLL